VPSEWLAEPKDAAAYNGRLIGAAMLAGVVVAALTSWQSAGGVAKAFFEGAGYAFTHIISLIVTARCFGTGVELIKLDSVIGNMIGASRTLLFGAAAFLPLGFALISGSGFAATQSLFGLFIDPSLALELEPARIGAIVSIGSAAGRTMSPVAAVTLMSASLTDTNPLDLVRRVALPLLAGMLAVVVASIFTA
jgi:DcuC family C4-dicarboxylate transporter